MKLISKAVCGRRCLKAEVAKNYYQVQHVTMTTLWVASTHILLHCFTTSGNFTCYPNTNPGEGWVGNSWDTSNRDTSLLIPKGPVGSCSLANISLASITSLAEIAFSYIQHLIEWIFPLNFAQNLKRNLQTKAFPRLGIKIKGIYIVK